MGVKKMVFLYGEFLFTFLLLISYSYFYSILGMGRESVLEGTSGEHRRIMIPAEMPKPSKPLVVIDPGHGGVEPGTHFGSMLEKDINLDISLRLGKLLKEAGIDTFFTRQTDISVALKERAAMANDRNASLFISVHNNDMPGRAQYHGTETLYTSQGKEDVSGMDDEKLAGIIQNELVRLLGTRDNGIIFRPNLAVLRHTRMPAVIAEIAYISNEEDRKKLESEDFRQKSAQALANGVKKALRLMQVHENEKEIIINH